MRRQFWVIGAEYDDIAFTQRVDGTGELRGPYASYQEAAAVWREHAEQSRHKALTRYTIVSDLAAAPAGLIPAE